MTVTQRAKQIVEDSIKKDNLPVNGVYCYFLPSYLVEDTTHTIILLTEVHDMPSNYGSNHSTTMTEQVALNIFYSESSEVDADQLEQKLITAFEDHNYYVVYSPGRSVDPDTNQITKVFQFRKRISRTQI